MHRPLGLGNLTADASSGADAIRFNVRRLKGTLWFVGFVAFLAAGWTFWDIVQGKQQGRFTPRPPSFFQDLIWRDVDDGATGVPGPTFYDEAAYERTWLARIDGSLKPKPVDPEVSVAAAPTKVQIPALDSILEVGLVVYSDDPLRRFVAIEYKDDGARGATGVKSRRLHLTEGEPLKSPYDGGDYKGKVVKISPQTVTFAWGEDVVEVNPGLGRDGGDITMDRFSIAAMIDAAAAYEKAPEDAVQLDDGSWVLGLKDRSELSDNTQQVLDNITARTVTPTGGGRSYLELTVKPGSLPARYGFQTGDRIISVNGIAMPSMSAALNWAKNNSNLPQYHVVYERKGKTSSQTIYWKGD